MTTPTRTTKIKHTHATSETPEVMPKVLDYLGEDTRVVPSILVEEQRRTDLGSGPIPTEPYMSKEYQALEYERLWPKVWQMACREREISKPGDFYEYEIGTQSALIVRTEDGALRGYRNTCLHRGTKLKAGTGNASDLSCRFHAWTWKLDGAIKSVPCRWDFPGVKDEELNLPQVQVDTWQGFVFINFDLNAGSLADHIGETLTRHFDERPATQRVKVAHVVKPINANWKNAMNAFTESYHVNRTHPQTNMFVADCNTKYDTFGMHGRFHTCLAAPSPLLDCPLSAQDVIDAQISEALADQLNGAVGTIEIPTAGEDESARAVIAEWVRSQVKTRTGEDYSELCDAELVDGIMYHVFPNLTPWWSQAFPMVYRFRPLGSDPDWCLFDAMLLVDFPADADAPPDVPPRVLGIDEPWSSAPEMGALGAVLDQDVANMQYQTAGMKSDGYTHMYLADYQESIVRQFHENLARFVGR